MSESSVIRRVENTREPGLGSNTPTTLGRGIGRTSALGSWTANKQNRVGGWEHIYLRSVRQPIACKLKRIRAKSACMR